MNDINVESCVCIDRNILYQGIVCGNDADNISTFLIHGYWAGYVRKTSDGLPGSDEFFTSVCPPSFCSYNDTKFSKKYLLPIINSQEVMDAFVCGPHRSGVLCGKCRPDQSVYFHSPNYRCFPNKFCSFGWFFYIVSEILPLTAIFVAIMFFNISFTSGTINGFVLFAQTIDSLIINTYRSSTIDVFSSIYEVIYSLFNLNFFGINSLSYCLLKGTNTLDIIALKYVTIACALLLVIVTVLVMKRCSINFKFLARLKKNGKYVTHGLSAFLILCYAQCVQISFRLLLPTRLYGSTKNALDRELRVQYNGEIIWFSLSHLRYAFPALLCLVFVIIPPPVILLWHPLGKQFLSLCGLAESVLVVAIDKVLFVNKLKPLVDSFQSCFKDNCRYFAGLQFAYRISLFVSLLFGHGTLIYISILVHSASMLLAITTIQPYKRRIHNIVDGLLFANLLFINFASLFIDVKLVNNDGNVERSILATRIVQLVLIYVPIISAIWYFIFIVVLFIRQRRSKSSTTDTADPDFSYRLYRTDSLEISLRNLKGD